MCATCGCGKSDKPSMLTWGRGAAVLSPTPVSLDMLPARESRRIQVEEDILAGNNQTAHHNRSVFEARGTLVVNLMSSPGSGKTTLLVETLKRLKDVCRLAVVEGDQQTSLDADRVRATGVAAVQVNTGKGCHLDAQMVQQALEGLPDLHNGMLFIENVGNLVCPAGFDLGERFKVVVISVTEGEDKPLKYPDMFAAADLVVINKMDLATAVGLDLEMLLRNLRRVKPDVAVLQVSARSGQGLDTWTGWLLNQRQRHPATTHAVAEV